MLVAKLEVKLRLHPRLSLNLSPDPNPPLHPRYPRSLRDQHFLSSKNSRRARRARRARLSPNVSPLLPPRLAPCGRLPAQPPL